MSLLVIDIGTGTQDILVYHPEEPIERSLKLVLPSPTVVKAGEITRAGKGGRAVFLEGSVMGGGPIVRAVREHVRRGFPVYASPQAAPTLHDSLEKVREMGVRIVDTPLKDAVSIHTTDFMKTELQEIFDRFGIPFPDQFAFAVQDHGFSPARSNRIFRFELLKEQLEEGNWSIYALIQDPPRKEMTRMWALREQVPGALVMDTGPAAVLGMLCDPWVREKANTGITLVNAGNGHTLCFTLKGEIVHGVCEHHTMILTPARLREILNKLQNGTLTNEEIFTSGGHGAVVHEPLPTDAIAVTGPNRRMLLPSAYQAAPFGDMMLTGCYGVVRMWRRLRG
jgi:uncharacterized protein (DUF1786 family)